MPGTGSGGSEPITVSFITYAILIISPALSAVFLVLNYKGINNINIDKLNEILKTIPKNIQIKILENLKTLSSKIKDQLKTE